MTAEKNLIFKSHNVNATKQLAKKIGQNLKGGEVIELIGDVGAGKTTFVSGLAEGIEYRGKTSSPSYMIEQIYRGRITLHHFDFYRLSDPGHITHELGEALDDPRHSVVLEWAKTIQETLPKNRIKINLKVTGEHSRQLTISIPNKFRYVGVTQ